MKNIITKFAKWILTESVGCHCESNGASHCGTNSNDHCGTGGASHCGGISTGCHL